MINTTDQSAIQYAEVNSYAHKLKRFRNPENFKQAGEEKFYSFIQRMDFLDFSDDDEIVIKSN